MNLKYLLGELVVGETGEVFFRVYSVFSIQPCGNFRAKLFLKYVESEK